MLAYNPWAYSAGFARVLGRVLSIEYCENAPISFAMEKKVSISGGEITNSFEVLLFFLADSD